MKVILLPLVFLLFMVMSIAAVSAVIGHNTYIIGGEYVVHEGETLHGNLELFFTQVIIEKDTRVDGKILSVSSTIDVRGIVTGNISAIESEVEIEQPADVKIISREPDVIPFVILLPEIARWNLSIVRE